MPSKYFSKTTSRARRLKTNNGGDAGAVGDVDDSVTYGVNTKGGGCGFSSLACPLFSQNRIGKTSSISSTLDPDSTAPVHPISSLPFHTKTPTSLHHVCIPFPVPVDHVRFLRNGRRPWHCFQHSNHRRGSIRRRGQSTTFARSLLRSLVRPFPTCHARL